MRPGLIVTADDFGITSRISEGMMSLAQKGLVSQLSLLCNMPGTQVALRLAQKNPEIPIGLHLNLTEGKALSGHLPGITSRNSKFYSRKKLFFQLISGKISITHLEKEIWAQIQQMEDASISPAYLDSHQHVHIFPQISSIIQSIASEKRIQVRSPKPFGKRPFLNINHLLLRLLLQLNPIPKQIARNTSLSSVFDLSHSGIHLQDYLSLIPAHTGEKIHELMVHPYVRDLSGLKEVYAAGEYNPKEKFFERAFLEWEILNQPEAIALFQATPLTEF